MPRLDRLFSLGGIIPRSLHQILSAVDTQTRIDVGLDSVVETLDRSKPLVFNCLRQHFKSDLEAEALTIKLLNLCLAHYHFISRSTATLSDPYGMVVDPSNSCNLACPGCVHSQHAKALKLFDWNPGLIAENRVATFMNRHGPNATHVIFCNYGEPLMNVHTPDFIRLAKSYLIQTLLSTNLSVPRFDAEAYVESGLDFMVLSIDGATQDVYQRFRRKGNLELVFENIRKLVKAKKRLGKIVPILTWRFLGFEHNIHEIPMALEKARELGVNQFDAVPAWDVSWDDPDIRAADIDPISVPIGPESHRKALSDHWNPFPGGYAAEFIEGEFNRTWREKLERSPDAAVSAPEAGSTCQWLYKSITMDASGRIFPYCCSPRPNVNLNFAHFDNDASAEVFNSDKHRRSRLFFADRKAYEADREVRGLTQDPYCVRCEWDKSADPTSKQIRNYFQAADKNLFHEGSLDLLSSWS